MNSSELTLSQRLQNLPFELHYMIIEKYKNMYIFPEITKRNRQTLEILNVEINELNVDPEDLVDVSNICLFNRIFNQRDSERGKYFIYLNKCITGFTEYYFSLKYDERRIFKKFILEEDDIYILYSLLNHDKCIKIRDKFSSYIFENKHLMYLTDPDGLHSGATGGWCITNIMPIIFGTYAQRLEHWLKLIHGHFNRKNGTD